MATNYWLTNLTISVLVMGGLFLLRSAPPRPKMWLSLAGAAAWCVPWPTVSSVWQSTDLFVQYIRLDALQTLPQSATVFATSTPTASLPWNWIFGGLLTAGALLFAKRIVGHRRDQRALHSRSEPAPDIWAKAGLPEISHPVLVVDNLENAFVSGYRQPRIWLGRSQLNSPALGSILQHELVHIRQRDNLILLITAVLSDIFWWNPLVRVLTRHARRYVEMSCDHACQNSSPEYRENLARELMNREYRLPDSRLVNPISRNQSFNVYRLRQLARETSMKTRHFAGLGMLAIVSFLLVANVASSSSTEEQQIVTHLTVKTVTTESDGKKNTRSIETHFIGEPEVEALLRLASTADVLLGVRMVNDKLRVIDIESTDRAETQKALAGLQGTGLQSAYDYMVTRDAGRQIYVDVRVQFPGGTPLEVSLVPSIGEWSGVAVENYLLRVKPELTGSPPDEGVLFSAEISQVEQNASTLIATPTIATTFGNKAIIQVGHTIADEEFVIFVSLTPRRAR